MEFDGFYVNTDWLQTFSVKMVDGRGFRENVDSNSVLFNQTAIRMMGLKNPISTIHKLNPPTSTGNPMLINTYKSLKNINFANSCFGFAFCFLV